MRESKDHVRRHVQFVIAVLPGAARFVPLLVRFPRIPRTLVAIFARIGLRAGERADAEINERLGATRIGVDVERQNIHFSVPEEAAIVGVSCIALGVNGDAGILRNVASQQMINRSVHGVL